MNKQLKPFDVLGLGFMTFAFFLGAGNIIFPTMAGMLAGVEVVPTMLGFLLTAVGLPLLGLFAVAKAGGGISQMTKLLHPAIGVVISVAIFIIIGPLIAAPRTSLVAFELGVKSFGEEPVVSQWVYSLAFFTLATVLALFPGKLMDSIGKILTPLLIVLLLALSISVMTASGGQVLPTDPSYTHAPFAKGILDGYSTMDALASIMFGMLIVDLLKRKGITHPKTQYRYLIIAALIAAGGLAFVYISLFFLGSSFGFSGASSGGEILTAYVENQFGVLGLMVLAGVITLACLTTAIGLLSACSDYFSQLTPLSYNTFVIINAVFCVMMANLELGVLIEMSIPVLVAVYPIAVALMLFSVFSSQIALKRQSLALTLAVSLFFGLMEGLKAAGISVPDLSFMPLFDLGLAWVAPTLGLVLIYMLVGKVKPALVTS
ncbi:branched-chain amino acid transport system II carrier protein [Oceanospirillum maris]|uniref:branched-chain amino acid transport system II carrier protein n=1 Tax=Oceanospirillum maris TaxID=64977 RepID=UPI00048A3760|nr:branched-chain amino acid transport system II carrier protein [Oceanospirillum maris]